MLAISVLSKSDRSKELQTVNEIHESRGRMSFVVLSHKCVKELDMLQRCNATCMCMFMCAVAVRQYADICLFSTAQYKCPVAEVESEYVT